MTFENLSDDERKLILKVLYEIDFLLQRTICSEKEYSELSFDTTTCNEIYRDTLKRLLFYKQKADQLNQIKQLLK